MKKLSVIIPAGGSSTRFGSSNKLLEILKNGKTVIQNTLDIFLGIDEVYEIVISVSSALYSELEAILGTNDKIRFAKGGANRQESVFNALKTCSKPDFVLIHDAARPFVSKREVEKVIEEAKIKKNVILAVKTTDTIKIVDKNGKIISTPDRRTLWNVQTPQVFEFETILDAHEKLQGKDFTDDAMLLESEGIDVYVTEGEYSNIKITTKNDLQLAKNLI